MNRGEGQTGTAHISSIERKNASGKETLILVGPANHVGADVLLPFCCCSIFHTSYFLIKWTLISFGKVQSGKQCSNLAKCIRDNVDELLFFDFPLNESNFSRCPEQSVCK